MTTPTPTPTPTQPTLDHATRRLAGAYTARLREVKNSFVERDEAVDVVALATLCREHVLLIGPPGTAKTSLLDRFRQTLDARFFSYLLTRFTEPAELFGPVDIPRLRTDGVYRINTTGMLPEAHIAFLDEVFQGSSAILNTLLTVINERVFHNGAETEQINLITLLGSSNEIPDDPVLAAFSDRFLLRFRLDYVDEDIERVLAVGWAGERDLIAAHAARSDADGDSGEDPERDGRRAARGAAAGGRDRSRPSARFDLADLRTLQRAVADVELAAVRAPLAQIVRSLRAEGVVFSDRRAVKAQKVVAAHALLAGRGAATVADLVPLVHLWTRRRDEESIRRILTDHEVPVDDTARASRSPQEIILAVRVLAHRRDAVAQDGGTALAEQYRSLLGEGHRLLLEVRRDHPSAAEALAEAHRFQDDTLALYRDELGGKEPFDV